MSGSKNILETAYTPGPRTIARDDGEDGEIYYAVHGDGYEFVANFDNKADAALDAAAPDLLAMLKAIRFQAGECIEDHPKWLEKIDALIAKAEGRS